MRKKQSSGVWPIIGLLFIIPMLIGIWKGGNFIIEDFISTTSESINQSENEISIVDIYVNSKIVKEKNYNHLQSDLAERVEVDFKMPGTNQPYNKKISYVRSQNAKKVMANITMYQNQNQYVKLVFNITEKIQDFNILFTDENSSFFFTLVVDFDFNYIDDISLPNVTIYR